MTVGIYMLSWPQTHKVYIGQSEVSIEDRFAKHCRDLRNETHSIKMNAAYQEFGLPTIEIIEECSIEQLDARENYHIKLWNAVDDGFNTMYCATKGTSGLHGEAHPASKYLDKQLLQVLDLLIDDSNFTQKEISNITGVSTSVIADISSCRQYNRILKLHPDKHNKLLQLKYTRNSGDASGTSKYTNDQIIEAFHLLVDSPEYTQEKIQELTNVSKSAISMISCGRGHVWLCTLFPEKYAELMSIRGKRSSAKLQGLVFPSILSPKNILHTVDSLTDFSKAHGLDPSALRKVLTGGRVSHKGWKLPL